MKTNYLTGLRFGRWIVLNRHGSIGNNSAWNCLCDCGVEKIVNSQALREGHSSSCGCYRKEVMSSRMRLVKNINISESKTYKSWLKMRSRCNDMNDIGFNNYGGRGIKICKEWDNFLNFLKDMGERPKGTSIDRIDVDGNYEPKNCKWSSKQEQNGNRRNIRFVEIDGEKINMREASRRLNIDYYALRYQMIKRGKTLASALQIL
jgi:hypothetical protein